MNKSQKAVVIITVIVILAIAAVLFFKWRKQKAEKQQEDSVKGDPVNVSVPNQPTQVNSTAVPITPIVPPLVTKPMIIEVPVEAFTAADLQKDISKLQTVASFQSKTR